ncbi:MAG: hypothetical protein JO356_06125, partial [Acidobacteria bacterium]|nr:hypothetical protein [Acidobacteriota bacterium]
MSHILDALTKSAIEGSGIEIQSSLLATALLEAVERQRAANHSSSSESQLPRSLVADHRPSRRSAQPSSEELAMAMRAEQSEGRVQFPSVPVLIAPESRLVAVTDGESLAAEKFRFLAVRLRQLQQHRALKKVLITSTIPQEGKSMAAANLASTLARKTSQRVLLLEGDLRRPTLTQMFGLGKIPGLNEWLQRERASLGSIYYLEDVGLWFLPAGSPLRDPLELMQSGR